MASFDSALGHGLFSTLRRELKLPPDPQLVDVGESGELLVAQVRLVFVSLLLLMQLMPQESRERAVGTGVTGAAFVLAAVVFALVRREYRPWLGFASCALDVSLISAGLAVFLVLGLPHTAVNSKVIFEAYFLAIAGSGLRYNWRLSALTGALAVLQYALIVMYASMHWDLNDSRYAPFEYGMFSWSAQLARLLILASAGLLSTTVVLRAHRLRRLSTLDRLTGLLSRRALEDRLLEEGSRARRYGREVAVAFVDIDHFKRVNDAHGHASGDAVLRLIAQRLRDGLRKSDIVGRFGGEEFVVILPETTSAEAHSKLETLRASMAATPLPGIAPGPQLTVTVSMGVASWPDDGVDIDAVLRRADGRLYDAKAAGRNRVVGPATP